jgi:beta-lactamase class A
LRSLAAVLAVGSLLVAAPLRSVADPASQGPSASGWKPNVAAARRYARRRAGKIDFDVIDTQGREYGYHPTRTSPMASTFKVMLLATYLRRPSVAHRRLNRFDRRLLVPMIRRSDNVAATRVRNIDGAGPIRRLARAAHMHRFSLNPVWGLSRTSPRDQARFMDHFDRFVPSRHRAFALHQLAHIVPSQRWGIGRLHLPAGWRLYFKGGWATGTGRVDHQIAFLQAGRQRVALAIYTEFDPNHGYGKQTLQGIAGRLLHGLPAVAQ